jgi:hypothetical protein
MYVSAGVGGVARALSVVEPRIQCHYFPDAPRRIKRVSQTQQQNVRKQYYIMLAGLHVSTLPESSSGPQGTDPYSE